MAHEHGEHDHDHHHHEHEHKDEHEPIDYVDAVEAFRRDKDHYFRHGEGSPLPEAEREGFEGLPYFAVDPDLRFEGLELAPYAGSEPQRFQIPTSDGQLRPAHRAGSLHFELGGEPRSLAAYVMDAALQAAVQDVRRRCRIARVHLRGHLLGDLDGRLHVRLLGIAHRGRQPLSLVVCVELPDVLLTV